MNIKITLLSTLISAVGFAQQPKDSSAKTMEEVVISGTLREVTKAASPIPVETYSARFFNKNVTPCLFDALSIVNGVQPQLNCNVCNTGDIHINGMEGPYTMVLIDGMPIVSSLATVYGFSGIPTSLIKRVEVVKGPASTLYGSEAVAGLINIITKDPATADRFTADVNVSSYHELSADMSARLKFGKASSLIGVTGFLFDKQFDVNKDNFTDITLQKRISVFNKWSFERKKNRVMSIAIRGLYEDRWGGEMQWSKRWRGTDSIYGESIYTKRVELIGNYSLPVDAENFTLEYSYNYHNQNSYYGAVPYMAKQHTAFAQLRWDKSVGKHYILFGMPWRYIWYDDNTPATHKPDGRGNNPSVNINKGLFVQDEIKLSPVFTTLAGLRYEHNNLQGNIWSPRLAVKYQPSLNHTIRLSGGNGFRVVNLFTEDHQALSGAREVIISEALKPEKSWNGNINYNASFGVLKLDVSAFYTYFTNKIVPDYNTDPQKIIYSNLKGHAVSKGISANIDVSYTNGFKILTGFTWMDVYTKEHDAGGKLVKEQQFFAPDFSANYAIGYTIKKWDLTVDLTGKVYGPQRLPVVPNDFRPEYSPWFTLMNIQFTKKISQQLEVYANIKNLLNFMPSDPILRPFDPFDKYVDDPVNNPYGYTFDPSYNYAPVQRIRALVGMKMSLQ